ncbi:response regulator transcription factor [Paraburkholderia dinghuensis]|uniref:DNA-binding response regulator n=1 Tax=Paraburkholderia dinghuensis TaxID=2305225 RepID=A0A3N6MQD9_9BURK|nr:response regulator transcription factor [Paraburkholderia dinghuensis]RQG99870.1 DNA-binding response regulator [Paraburkholderia dinghuensis]
MRTPVRVIIADDHECVRVGVAGLLSASLHMTVVAEAHDTQTLAEQLDHYPCDVVVSDVWMPGMHGEYSSLAMLRRLIRGRRGPAVVVLTMVSSAPVLTGLLQFGLTVIVDKRDVPFSLLPAIEAASCGIPYLSDFARTALQRAGNRCPPCAGVPSAREWEVFQLYAQGMPIREIASRLGRSAKTISTQKRSTMRKLGLESERDLMDFAKQIGLT